jgi:cysteine desulfurase
VNPREVVLTSGGTESITAALHGAFAARRERGRTVVASAVEHPATLAALDALAERRGAHVTLVGVEASGALDPGRVLAALTDDTAVVTLMHANNETGALFDLAPVGAACRARGIVFHVDAVQSFGKVPVDPRALGTDLLSISGHKIGGPMGTGALYVRRGTPLASLLHGGPQERGRRAGTENAPVLAGFGLACERAVAGLATEVARLTALRDALEHEILREVTEARVNTAPDVPRVSNTISVRLPGVDAARLVQELDLRGVQAATGAACAQAARGPSHVLTAMGLTAAEAGESLRFSFGRGNDRADVPLIVGALRQALAALPAPGPAR